MEALLDTVLPNGEDLDQEMTDQQLAEATHEELNQPAAAQTDSQTHRQTFRHKRSGVSRRRAAGSSSSATHAHISAQSR